MGMDIGMIIGISVGAVALLTLFVLMQPGLWFRALISGTYVSVIALLRMRFKHLDSQMLVNMSNTFTQILESGVQVALTK